MYSDKVSDRMNFELDSHRLTKYNYFAKITIAMIYQLDNLLYFFSYKRHCMLTVATKIVGNNAIVFFNCVEMFVLLQL